VRLESLLPRVAHRQWTLSLPFSVRFQVVKKPTLLKRLEVRLVKAVWRWQRREARRHGATGALTGGAICFWQWFGSSLQLTPHRHLVVAEAQWGEDGTVAPVAAPSDEDVARILARVLSQAKKDWAWLENVWPEDDFEELQARAIQERLGLAEPPQRRHHPRRVAVRMGFSLHADTAVHGNDRQGLERLCRYGARGAVAKVAAPAPRRWPVRVFAEEGHHLHRHRGSAGASARRAAPSREASPHLVPRRLRTQRQPAAPHHPTACAFATSADAQRDTGDEGFSACETDAAAARLGPASPAHLRHRRVALPLWRKAHHQAPPFHPQAGRSPPHRARRHLALAGAAASHRAAAVVALDVKATSRFSPTSPSLYRCARSTPTPTHLGRNGLADPRAADFRSAQSSLGRTRSRGIDTARRM
jgi:hypothetical protein